MKYLRFFILVSSATLLISMSQRNTCEVPSFDSFSATGDATYGRLTCDQKMIDQFWNHFDFDKGDWDDGFGYHDPCNLGLPLARTFNALYLLAYSAEDYANNTSDFSGNALRWAYPYAATHTDELDAKCGGFNDDGSLTFATSYSGFFVNDRVQLKLPFFYRLTVSERAGTIVHESRHQAGKGHNGSDDCPRGASCDSSWAYEGANMFQVLYLWWFAVDGTRTTTAMKDIARNRARAIHNRGFIENPGFSI